MAVGYGKEDSSFKEQQAHINSLIENAKMKKVFRYCIHCCSRLTQEGKFMCPSCIAKPKK